MQTTPRISATPARRRILPLFVMIDAAGWEILRSRPFLSMLAPHRRRLESVFGYSSACVPSIVSGRWPDEHRNWCYFVHDPEHSPFARLRWLRWLPKALTGRRIVRRWLTKLVKRALGFRGYFDLYNIPFQHIHRFDFTEKRSPLQPGGMNRGSNIFDQLTSRGIPHYVNDPARPEPETRDELLARIEKADLDFAFVYWAGLDGLMHAAGNDSPLVDEKLAIYEQWIGQLVAKARGHYDEVRLFVFSDHGMANCDEVLDLQKILARLSLEFGRDYTAVFDSTMARFWFHTADAREQVTALLENVPQGRIIGDAELAKLRVPRDGTFGETVFLVREGVLIVPSHMGERPLRAMHGYHPSDPQSHAALLSSVAAIPASVTAIPHIHRLMLAHAVEAHAVNNDARTKTHAA